MRNAKLIFQILLKNINTLKMYYYCEISYARKKD
jgi:hypothetical protein